MPIEKLKEFLDGNKVKYVTIRHSTAYTAQETAASAHIPGKELAKTVVLRIDGKMTMAVLPASHKLDIPLLKKAVGARDVEIAHEPDFRDMFPGCDTGAMPPFGNLYRDRRPGGLPAGRERGDRLQRLLPLGARQAQIRRLYQSREAQDRELLSAPVIGGRSARRTSRGS